MTPGEAPQWAQERAQQLLKEAPKDMVLWMVLAHGLAEERDHGDDALWACSAFAWQLNSPIPVRLEHMNPADAFVEGAATSAQEIAEFIDRKLADYRREQQKDETR